MNKLEWEELCRKTAWVGNKKYLSKKELFALQSAQITLQKLNQSLKKDNFQVAIKEPMSIQSILKGK